MPSATAKSAQDFVPIKEVRDGVVVMRDNSLRVLLMASSINFALQSEDSQTAIIVQFQNFLNSLDFSVQIFIESHKMDIKPYLGLLEERYKATDNDLLKIQIREYVEFVKTFTDNTNIMTKTFFVVIPYSSASSSIKKGVTETMSGLLNAGKKPTEPVKGETDDFHERKMQLQQRTAVVEQGLMRCGLRTAHLGSEELIELFYKLFNPGESDKPISLQ